MADIARWLLLAVFLGGCLVGAEGAGPVAKARVLLMSGKEVSSAETDRLVADLQALAAQRRPNWEEAAFLAVELGLSDQTGRRTDLVRAASDALLSSASKSWKARGEIGRLRLRTLEPDRQEDAVGKLLALSRELEGAQEEAGIDAAYYAGVMLKKLGHEEQALDAFRTAVRLRESLQAYSGKDIYAGLLTYGELRAALKDGKEVDKKPRDPAHELFFKARKEQDAGRYAVAIGMYQQVIRQWPEHADAHESEFRIPESHYRAREMPEALREAERFVCKETVGRWTGAGLILHADLQLEVCLNAEEAEKAVERFFAYFEARKADWQDLEDDAWLRLGAIRYIKGDKDGSLDALQRASMLRPRSAARAENNVPSPMEILVERIGGGEELVPGRLLQGGSSKAKTALVLGALYYESRDLEKAGLLFGRLNPPPKSVTADDIKGVTERGKKAGAGKPGANGVAVLAALTARDPEDRKESDKRPAATFEQCAYARRMEGLCYYEDFGFSAALGCQGEFLHVFDKSREAAEALTNAVVAADGLNVHEKLLSSPILAHIEKRFPGTWHAANAAYWGALANRAQDPTESLRLLRLAANRYPNTEMARMLKFWEPMLEQMIQEKSSTKGDGK